MRKLVAVIFVGLVAVGFSSAQEPVIHPITENGITKPSKEDTLPACPAKDEAKPRDGVFKVGSGVTAPKATHQVIASFSKEARKKKIQGTAIVQLTVDKDGMPKDMCMMKTVGYGLDQQAALAVRQYRFQPAMYEGQPVPAQISVEVSFRLY